MKNPLIKASQSVILFENVSIERLLKVYQGQGLSALS